MPGVLNTPSTKAFVTVLAKYAHQTAAPDLNEYYGWASASAIIRGLQAAGTNPNRESFISGLRSVDNFTADGLTVSPVSFTASFGTGAEGQGPAPGGCYYVGQYRGTQWVWQPKPICGELVPNSNAS